MAKKLKQEAVPKAPITSEQFGEYMREYALLRQAKNDAAHPLISHCKRMKSAGINVKMAVRTYDEQRSDIDKVKIDIKDLEQYRAWMGLPVGYQGALDLGANGASFASEPDSDDEPGDGGSETNDAPEEPLDMPAEIEARGKRGRRASEAATAH
jgi:hypothetical protein